MRLKFPIAVVIHCMLCIPCLGIHYRVVSLSATGAVVAYSLDSLEISAASPQRAFVFAISSQPGAVCVFAARG
jgi:hypothetical protein